MTSQIVLLNGLGVAMASDSAVSAGDRVMNASEKIFDLPKPHKIAILISGSAEFMGYPWEVLFDAWSGTLNKSMPSVLDYGNSLSDWLKVKLPSHSTMATLDDDFIKNYMDSVLPFTHESLRNIVMPKVSTLLSQEELELANEMHWGDGIRELVESKIGEDTKNEIREWLEGYVQWYKENFSPADGISSAQANVWVTRYLSIFTAVPDSDQEVTILDYWINDIPFHNEFRNLFIELCCATLTNPHVQNAATLVVAGFGDNELFPAYWKCDLYGVVSGNLIKKNEVFSESTRNPRWVSLGQTGAIDQLIDGYDQLVEDVANTHHRNSLLDIEKQIPDIDDPQILEFRARVAEKVASDSISNSLKPAGREHRTGPFQNAISMSPLANLADYASQLVGVQAAHASMTQANPTVGGPIDVATITRRSGFVWVNHK